MTKQTATFSLLPSVKRDWLKALRSGEYTQGEETLYHPDDGSFCCLGVLCEVNGINRKYMAHKEMPDCVGFGEELLEHHRSELHPDLVNYSLSEAAWSVFYRGKLRPLSFLNDVKKLSFKQIANIIEKQVPTHRG